MHERESSHEAQNRHLEAALLGVEFLRYLFRNKASVSLPRIEGRRVVYQKVNENLSE